MDDETYQKQWPHFVIFGNWTKSKQIAQIIVFSWLTETMTDSIKSQGIITSVWYQQDSKGFDNGLTTKRKLKKRMKITIVREWNEKREIHLLWMNVFLFTNRITMMLSMVRTLIKSSIILWRAFLITKWEKIGCLNSFSFIFIWVCSLIIGSWRVALQGWILSRHLLKF